MYKEDCFAYVDFGNCSALKKAECESCSFYKTKKEYTKGLNEKLIKSEQEKIECKISYYMHLASKRDIKSKERIYCRDKIAEYKYKYENYQKLIEQIKAYRKQKNKRSKNESK